MRSTEASNVNVPPSDYNVHLTGYGEPDTLLLASRVKATIREMFRDRGYVLVDNISGLDIDGWDGSGHHEPCYVLAREKGPVIAKVLPYARVGIAECNAFFAALQVLGVRHGILVASEFSTQQASVSNLYPDIEMEKFTTIELSSNPARHELVCRHEVLGDEETESFKDNFRVNNTFDPRLLPALTPSDMMARYYHLREGDIVRIHRSTLTCTKEPQLDAFRVVRG
jgi:DNA-directed RNA polymerase I, II, and III subunit RPABC1